MTDWVDEFLTPFNTEGARGRKMKKEKVRDDGKRHTPLTPLNGGIN